MSQPSMSPPVMPPPPKALEAPWPTVSHVADRVAAGVAWTVALGVAAVLLWIVWGLLRGATDGEWGGWEWWEWIAQKPQKLGVQGGIGPVLVSTMMILAVCLGAALPLGLGTAVLLTETGATRGDARLARLVRRSLDVLAGVPSIVFGLFGSVLFCEVMGMGFSIKAGGLTLACMVLPIFIRAAEEGLRAVPETWRHGAAALGLSRAATLRRVVLPAALPGLMVGLVLGMGRALAETAALLFTAGTVLRMPGSLNDSGRALSVHIYELSMFVNGGEPAAYRSAMVLVGILLVINMLAAGVGRLGVRV
ncbi:MAG: phosphate ABC transporter permease PstA [Algisphaera sp.]